VVSWVITDGAKAEAAQRFVRYMMSEGYERWLAVAPEGKLPTRRGTEDDAEAYAKAWDRMPAGVDTKKPLADIYSADVLSQLKTGVDTFSRWGITQGQGNLVGATLGELPVPKAINAMTSGELAPEAAAQRANKEVELIKESQ
jgi:multiple sugar transport system substrate-binding protein